MNKVWSRWARGASAALRRPLAALMAAVLVLGGLLAPIGPAVERAWAAGETAYVHTGREIRYGGGGKTSLFEVQGALGYCSDPMYDTPVSGTYPVKDAKTRPGNSGIAHPIEYLRAVVYYGWGAPGFDRSMWPTTDWDGTQITDDEFYAYTHVLIADHMWRAGEKGLMGTSLKFKRWFCHNILGYAWGTDGWPVTNENAMVFQAYRRGAPTDFRVIELDTGNNSIYTPGRKSQTILSFVPDVTVSFTKLSADSSFTGANPEYSVAGAEYDIFLSRTGEKAGHIVMDAGGHATLRLKPSEYYYAVETKAPKGYKLNTERIEFKTGNSTTEEKLLDDPGRVVLKVQKKDIATNGDAQPGTSLEGAEYKLVDANGNTQIGKTDSKGRLQFKSVPFGKVVVTETKAPTGYKLDPTPHEYYISSENNTATGVFELEPADDFKEAVIAFDLELVKYKDTGAEGSGLQDPARDVKFDIISNTTGEAIGSIVTDERGYASTRGEWFGQGSPTEEVKGAIPYDPKGYTVREDPATTPEGYQPCGDWTIGPDQIADGTTLSYIVDNDFVSSHLQVVKVDAETGQNVALAGFTFQLLDQDKNPISQEVWYPNHTDMTEFTTDETGSVTLPEALRPGTYYIRESATQAPYLLNGEDVKVVIPNIEDLAPVTVVKVADEQAMGRAEVVKTCSEDGTALAGAEFDVVAVEDVVSPDGTVRAVSGEVVDHLVTGEDGRARTKELYLGGGTARYAFVETKAPSGHVLDPTPHELELSFADGATPLVETRVDVGDDPTHVVIQKTDAIGGEALEGAGFALWDRTDEVPVASDDRTSLAIAAPEGADVRAVRVVDEAVVSASAPEGWTLSLLDADGDEIDAGSDGTWPLDQGVYTVRAEGADREPLELELKARTGRGYTVELTEGLLGPSLQCEERNLEWETKLEWSDEDGAHVGFGIDGLHRVTVDGRTVGEVEIDGDTWAEVANGELERVPILLRDGHEPEVKLTDEQGRIDVTHLPAGDYRVVEVSAPAGYLVDATPRDFTIGADGLIGGERVHEIGVADDFTKLDVSKLDATDESELPGAHMAILDEGGEVVDSWVSDGAPHRVEKIAPGRYTLVEEMSPRQYDMAGAVEFEVLATGEVQKVVMHDDPIEISAEVDKRQEIADPTAPDTEADGDGGNKAEVTVSEDGSFDYSVDFRSTSSTWVDEFTVEDALAGASSGVAELTSLTLPVAAQDHDGLLNVWYKTDKTAADYLEDPMPNATLQDGHENPWLADEGVTSEIGEDGRALDYAGWRIWREGASATEAQTLEVSELGLEEGEKVTAIRLEYGRVEEGFTSRTGEWDRDDLKDPHDDLDDVSTSHGGDEMTIQGFADIALEDGQTKRVALDELEKSEDGAGWMLDADGDGAPEFHPFESVVVTEDASAERAPLVLHMRVTDAYAPGTELVNEASVHAYRNGGGDGLEGHDGDLVKQVPKSTTPLLPQTGATPAALTAAAGMVALAALAMIARRRVLSGTTYYTDCFGDRIH